MTGGWGMGRCRLMGGGVGAEAIFDIFVSLYINDLINETLGNVLIRGEVYDAPPPTLPVLCAYVTLDILFWLGCRLGR